MKCERDPLRLLFLVSLAAWLLLAPSPSYSADIKDAPTSSADMTPQPSPGLPSETQPMPSWDNFDAILTALEQESEKLSAELATISAELTRREAQAKELESALQASAVRIASLERSISTERKGAETAISSALDREQTACRERDFWRVGGITLAGVGIVALALSFIF